MTSSLVGSEMCIRDRRITASESSHARLGWASSRWSRLSHQRSRVVVRACLLYTSDAADDM
eukprot:8553794-Prorocentrum_lima.AAC.1